MTLQEYLNYLGWNRIALERAAKLNAKTVRKALAGDPVSSRVAQAIAEALSEAMGKPVFVGDIEGLKVG